MDRSINEAVTFFKSEGAYQKLFKQFKKKYESLGRIGGTVPVQLFSEEELAVIGSFFGMPGERLEQKNLISVASFERQLADTKFGDIGLKALLDAYFGEEIISKKQYRQNKEEGLRQFVESLRENHPALDFWFAYLLKNRGDVRWIWKLIDNEQNKFAAMTTRLENAYNLRPSSPERLPMFSQRITGNPHAFDLHTDQGRLWLHLMAVASETTFPSTTEDTNELLQNYQIYRDDLLNYVTCAGLYAETEGGMHPVWQSAVEQNTVQIVPIRELIKLANVYPSKGSDVWIVENSGVCATLLDYKPYAPIVCTNGQFTLAALTLLDRLVESGCVLHYAGDFDPEGLGMAQRLLERFSEGHVKLWHMNTNSYTDSNPVKELTEERLEKLNRINHANLLGVADAMRKKGKAGYQEALVGRMIDDI